MQNFFFYPTQTEPLRCKLRGEGLRIKENRIKGGCDINVEKWQNRIQGQR